jgi:hypothetical protein
MSQVIACGSTSDDLQVMAASAVISSQRHPLDLLLELVCLRLQLSSSQHAKAVGHYEAVSTWLAKVGSPIRLLAPHIFPQGSLQLGTTTMPLKRAEFDLDLACILDVRIPCHPGEIYRLIWDRLAQHSVYRPMMKRLPRCIRLEYSGDFHLDIVPAVPDREAGGTCILVPDLDADLAIDHPENDEFKPSNPRGFAEWFEDKCKRIVSADRLKMAKVDPVPDQEPVHQKPALKRSVQLFKRWRDIEFQDRQKAEPPSIVLTTLCGHLYRGEGLCSKALQSILNQIVDWIEGGRSMCLTNPANVKEKICERWEDNPASYRAFADSVTGFRDRWERLVHARCIPDIEEELSELFDEAPVHWAIKQLAEHRVVAPRRQRTLRVAPTGALGVPASVAGTAIPPNTFFGDSHNVRKKNRPA